MESRSIFRVASIAVVIALSGVLAACGGGDGDEEPTATTAPANAQPTVDATVESTPPSMTPEASAPANVVPPRNTDMSSPRTEVTEEPTVEETESTPEAGATAPVMATPASQADTERAASPTVMSATIESTPGGSATGDGTSGASSGAEAAPATPTAPATPVPSASPAVSATPEAATPGAAASMPVVTSCDVEDIPAYTGDVTVYLLSVDLNFRDGPGADCDLIGDGPLGEFSAVEIIGGPVEREGDESGEWVQVAVGDRIGWLALDFLEPAE